MNRMQANRAAPAAALFVILAGVFFFLTAAPSAIPVSIPTVNPSVTEFVIPSQIQFHRGRGDFQAALYHIEALAAVSGWTASLHVQVGLLWSDMGDMTRALPHWEVAIQQNPTADVLRRVAEIYLKRGDWGTAYERINHLLRLLPDDSWGLYYGGLLLAPSDPLTAREYLSRAAVEAPIFVEMAQNMIAAIGDDLSDPLVSSRVGAVLANAGEWSLAENAFQYAAAVNYPFPEATAFVGLMRAQRGWDGRSWIEQAVSIAPDNPDVRYVEGLYWRAIGEYEQSVSAFLTTISLAPAVPQFYAELGTTYRMMGNLSEAEYWLQTAISISDNDPLMRQALERLYTEESYVLTVGELNYSRTARAQENDPSVLSANGYVLHILGDSEAGMEFVDRALEADPENPRAQFDKSRILLETGHADEARSLLTGLSQGDSPFAPIAERLLRGLD